MFSAWFSTFKVGQVIISYIISHLHGYNLTFARLYLILTRKRMWLSIICQAKMPKSAENPSTTSWLVAKPLKQY